MAFFKINMEKKNSQRMHYTVCGFLHFQELSKIITYKKRFYEVMNFFFNFKSSSEISLHCVKHKMIFKVYLTKIPQHSQTCHCPWYYIYDSTVGFFPCPCLAHIYNIFSTQYNNNKHIISFFLPLRCVVFMRESVISVVCCRRCCVASI